jgi:hypothetical protein
MMGLLLESPLQLDDTPPNLTHRSLPRRGRSLRRQRRHYPHGGSRCDGGGGAARDQDVEARPTGSQIHAEGPGPVEIVDTYLFASLVASTPIYVLQLNGQGPVSPWRHVRGISSSAPDAATASASTVTSQCT